MVHFSKQYQHYLSWAIHLLQTDHAWFEVAEELQGARWLETLESLDYYLQHRPSVKHGNVEALSWSPSHQCQGLHEGEVIHTGQCPKAEVYTPAWW